MSASGPTSGWYSSRGWKSIWAPSRAPASSTWLISSSSRDTAWEPLPSRAISRSAMRKVSIWVAICEANCSSSITPPVTSVLVCSGVSDRVLSHLLIAFLRMRGRG